jgi:uncharacterized spore protein YtfJ
MDLNIDLDRLITVDERIMAGEKMMAGDRAIWPVMRITVLLAADGWIQSMRIRPFAMLIIEPEKEYAISFDGRTMTVEALLDVAPFLGDVLKQERKGSRIVVDQAMECSPED